MEGSRELSFPADVNDVTVADTAKRYCERQRVHSGAGHDNHTQHSFDVSRQGCIQGYNILLVLTSISLQTVTVGW
jgi:hypothetical protein